jgi:hypothetical protein
MMTFQITREIINWLTTKISLQINILQPCAILYKAQATCTSTRINKLYHVICLKKRFQMIGNEKHLLFHLKVLNLMCNIIFHTQDGKLNPWSCFHASRQQPQVVVSNLLKHCIANRNDQNKKLSSHYEIVFNIHVHDCSQLFHKTITRYKNDKKKKKPMKHNKVVMITIKL